jgi:hypothetical protein
MPLWVWASGLWLLALGQTAPAPDPGIAIRVRANPSTATVGDPITLDFDVEAPAGTTASFPSLDKTIGEFTVLETFPGPTVPAQAGSKTADQAHGYRARVVAAVYRVGKFEFPALTWRVKPAAGGELEVKSPAVPIEVKSVLDGEPKLKDLKQQAEIYERPRWGLWIAAAVALLLLGLLAWRLLRRRRAPETVVSRPPELDPFTLAEVELRDLLGRGLLEKGFVKQFYVALAEIARKVLEAGFGVRTSEKTTGEILDELRGLSVAPAATAEELARIESFLTACDFVKFARYLPARSESDAAVSDAAAIITLCKQRRAVPTPAASPPPVPA